MALSDCFVEPLVVELDGEPYSVTPFTLADLAFFQRFVESQDKHPFDERADELASSLAVEDRQRILRECYLASRTWGPVFGSRRSAEVMALPLGRMVLLRRMLARHQEVTGDRILELARKSYLDQAVRGQYLELLGVVNDRSPQQRMESAIDRHVLEYHDAEDDDDDDLDYATLQRAWGERVTAVMEQYGWTFDQVGGLTLRQFRCAESRGRVDDRRRIEGDPASLRAEAKRRRAALGLGG